MLDEIGRLIIEMTGYFEGDPKRIQHFIKVHSFAQLIGDAEELDVKTNYCLNVAAVVHDIGIKTAEEKNGKGNCGGKLQEKYGPKIAEKMLTKLNFSSDVIERVCFLIAHHHTYNNVDSLDWQILLEADFLVNAYEDNLPEDSIINFREKVFKTKTGIDLLNNMFGLK